MHGAVDHQQKERGKDKGLNHNSAIAVTKVPFSEASGTLTAVAWESLAVLKYG